MQFKFRETPQDSSVTAPQCCAMLDDEGRERLPESGFACGYGFGWFTCSTVAMAILQAVAYFLHFNSQNLIGFTGVAGDEHQPATLRQPAAFFGSYVYRPEAWREV